MLTLLTPVKNEVPSKWYEEDGRLQDFFFTVPRGANYLECCKTLTKRHVVGVLSFEY